MEEKEIRFKYEKLLINVKNDDFYKKDLTNRVNCYTCKKCGHITKTRDIDSGVTPFMHSCEKCNEMANSSFYNDIAPKKKHTQEWFRPTLKQVLKMNRMKQYGMIDHILSGGLDVRKI